MAITTPYSGSDQDKLNSYLSTGSRLILDSNGKEIGTVPDDILNYAEIFKELQSQNAQFGAGFSDQELADMAGKAKSQLGLGFWNQGANKAEKQPEQLNKLSNFFNSAVNTKQQQNLKDQINSTLHPEQGATPEQKAGYDQKAGELVQTNLGRAATADEISYFSNELAKGVSPFELGSFMQSSPEYQKIQADKQSARYKIESDAAQADLATRLLDTQKQAFAKAQPEILASYMRSGRLNSSGLDSAMAKAQADLESQRQAYLAQVGYQSAVQGAGYNRQDFLNQQNQGYQNYLQQSAPTQASAMAGANAQNQVNYGIPFQNLQNTYALQNQNRDRLFGMQDYYQEQSDYNNYLSQARKQSRENALYGLLGSAVGGASQGGAMALGK